MSDSKNLIRIRPDLVRLVQDARLDQEDTIRDWALAASVPGSTIAEPLVEFLQFKKAQQELFGAPFYTPTEAQLNKIPQTNRLIGYGFTESGMPVIRPVDDLAKGMSVWGMTGSGKSVFLKLVIGQALDYCPTWQCDRDKSEARSWVLYRDDVIVLNPQINISLNLFQEQPPLSRMQHMFALTELFCKNYDLMDLSRSLLITGVSKLYEKWDGREGQSPTLRDLRHELVNLPLRNRYRSLGALDSVLARIDTMLFECPDTYDCSSGFLIKDLAKQHIVFEFHELSEKHAKFLWLFLQYFAFLTRMRSGPCKQNVACGA